MADQVRVVFKDEYFCEECGEFIGSINKAFYITTADLILCPTCYYRKVEEGI